MNPARNPSPSDLPPGSGPHLAHLAARVEELLGLRFTDRPEDLWRGLKDLARARQEAPEALLDRLASAPLGEAEVDRLAPHLTVGETYFFRDMETLGALRDPAFPELLRRGGPVRIWCAACSTGEEAYTVAMLAQEGSTPLPPDRLTLLGTDLNGAALRKARRGHYTRWSFRGVPRTWMERFFVPLPDGVHSVRPRYRQGVTFREDNLLDPGSPFPDGAKADVVLCRNVLIYFSEETIRRVLGRLAEVLSPQGWLLVAPAEAPQVQRFGFRPTRRPSVFRHPSFPEESGPEYGLAGSLGSALLPLSEPFGESAIWEEDCGTPWGSEDPPPAPETIPDPILEDPGSPRDPLDLARRRADEGRTDEALSLCAQALERDRTDPTPYYLLGVIRQERGEDREAAESFRRAVYLDPSFVAAHHALATLALRSSRPEGATRHLRNAQALLEALDPDQVVPETGGLTAGTLRDLIRSLNLRDLP